MTGHMESFTYKLVRTESSRKIYCRPTTKIRPIWECYQTFSVILGNYRNFNCFGNDINIKQHCLLFCITDFFYF